VIVDERFNGGGSVRRLTWSDMLLRRTAALDAGRRAKGREFPFSPAASIFGARKAIGH
jgi:hypothetical protein